MQYFRNIVQKMVRPYEEALIRRELQSLLPHEIIKAHKTMVASSEIEKNYPSRVAMILTTAMLPGVRTHVLLQMHAHEKRCANAQRFIVSFIIAHMRVSTSCLAMLFKSTNDRLQRLMINKEFAQRRIMNRQKKFRRNKKNAKPRHVIA